MVAVRRARGARRPRLGSHRAAKCKCPRTGALGQRRCPHGSVERAPPPKPSQPRALLRLTVRAPPPTNLGLPPPQGPEIPEVPQT